MWSDFIHSGEVYRLSHLDPRVVPVTRDATEQHQARTVKFYISYADHCFTKHFAENDDESLLYQNSRRYFCTDRHAGSLKLPAIIPQLITNNVTLAVSIKEHRESFFYLEEHLFGVTYRLFFDLAKSNHPASDIRLKVLSAYPEESWAAPVSVAARFTFWRVIDARLSGEKLAIQAQKRRSRR